MRLTPAIRLSTLAVACAVTLPSAAQSQPRDQLVVSSSWLAAHLHDANLVLLHVGDRAEYDAKHIPGARYIQLSDVSISDTTPTGQVLEMPPAGQLHKALASFGIADNSRIVVYYGKDRVTPTTRVIYTLSYAGLGDRTSLLDGGMDAWTRDGNQVTNAVPPVAAAGRLSPLSIRPIVVNAEYVKAHIGARGFSIVDARALEFYNGTQAGKGRAGPHKAGHIAGAKSIPYTEITDDKLMLKPVDQLKDLFAKAGVAPTDTVIGYCHIGQQATGMLFAARITGHPVLLYDGSFDDWSRHSSDYPVENSAAKGKP